MASYKSLLAPQGTLLQLSFCPQCQARAVKQTQVQYCRPPLTRGSPLKSRFLLVWKKAHPGGWSHRRAGLRGVTCCSAGAELQDWLTESGLPPQAVKIQSSDENYTNCVAERSVRAGEEIVAVPEHLTITSADVAAHPVVAKLAEGRGELIGLTLWILYERSLNQGSGWWPYLQDWPEKTNSPLLWTAEQQKTLLRGSPARDIVKERLAALEAEYASLAPSLEGDPNLFDPKAFNLQSFVATFAVVLSRVIYLPSAECLALVPLADNVKRSTTCQAQWDYNAESRAVCLVADRSYSTGDTFFASYGPEKPNLELLINYGVVDLDHPDDYVEVIASLLSTDRLYSLKKPVIQAAGLQLEQAFPLFRDRFPTQLLSYLRLARLQDPLQLVKVTFEKDVIIDQTNEYEVLMLLMADLRDRLAAYKRGVDDDARLLKSKDLSKEERLAASLRFTEQRILTDTMAALRKRLAPIRGIPTKSGMQDPNSDIIEMFEKVEQVASAPGKFLLKVFGKGS